MPKKNGGSKKGFSFMGSKGKGKENKENAGTGPEVFPVEEKMESQSSPEERYSSFVQIPAEAKIKSQNKKQKKKERQNKLEIEKMELKNKKALQVSVLPDVEWESTFEITGCKKFVANVEEDVLKISEVNVFDNTKKEDWSNASSAMNEEEEKSLRDFLRTLEIADSRVREQNEMIKKSMDQCKRSDREYELIEFCRGIKTVEPIAEEVFEEMVDDNVHNQHIDGSPSYNRSPKSRRDQMKVIEEIPKILYSYNGIPFTNQDSKSTILVQDIDDGILVINNIRCKERDRPTFRQLDVIMEESSDFSDTSSVHSEKKNDSGVLYKTVSDCKERIFDGRGKTFDLQIQPVIKETVKIFPLHQKPTNGLKTDSTQVRIQTVFLEKVHPTSIVKIELPEKDSNEEEEKNLGENVDGGEIVSLNDRKYENIDIAGDRKRLDSPILFEESLSARHLLRNSKEIKFIDEESEPSWSSGGFNAEDGVDADVESELDSRRETFLFTGGDNDVSIDLDEIFDTNMEPDYGTIKKSPLKNRNSTSLNDAELLESDLPSSQGATPSQEIVSTVQKSVKNSPTLSGRDSVSSVASGGTVKYVKPILRNGSMEAVVAGEKVTSLKEEINLGEISLEEEFNLDSPYKNCKISAQVEEMRKKVNVRQLAESLENDLDKILKSKMKVIEFFEDPVMSEASWSNILRTVNGKSSRKSGTDEEDEVSLSGKSNFSLMRFKHHSNSSSYENVSKSRESELENENIYEAILTPEALSNLAEKKVMSLPYGHFLLRKIGLGKCCEDSKDAEDDIYTKIDAKVQSFSAESQHLTRSQSTPSADEKSRCLPCGGGKSSKKAPEASHPPYIEFNYSDSSSDYAAEKWYGMPTSHPSLLLGLSPSQRKAYEAKHRRFLTNEEEAANLLDLHKKFIERRSYNEGNPFRRDRTLVFDSKDIIYAEIVPKEKRASGKVIDPNRARVEVEEERATEAVFAKVDKPSEGSEDIGSCGLLAILQNATSDGFVEEMKDKTSCGSGFEATENTAKKQSCWQKEKKIGCESKYVLHADRPTEKEKSGETSKRVMEEKSILNEKGCKEAREDECIITKSLSSVSDMIKTFEEPTNSIRSFCGETSNNAGDIHVLFDNEKYRISKKGDIAVLLNDTGEGGRRLSLLSEQEEFKKKMYDEYMLKVAERLERRQQKQIKLSQPNERDGPDEGKTSDIENEFIIKARERMEKLGLTEESEVLDKTSLEFEKLYESEFNIKEVTDQKRNSIQLLLDASSDLAKLPKHLQEFFQAEDDDLRAEDDDGMAMISPTFKATAPRPGIWSPVQTTEEKTEVKEENEERKKLEDEPIPPVWTPKSAQASPILERKEFRPVTFESPTLPRKKYIQEERSESVPPPWQQPGGERLVELVKTPSSPALSLPKAPNPTVTLLQKAREGHIPRGAHYLSCNMSESVTDDGSQQNENSYSLRDDLERPKKIELGPKKITGIGPTTKEGIPLVLRSEVTEENKEKWYKRMYDSLHKAGKDEDYVTVKYRTSPSRKGLYGYQPVSSSGYQSEPESIIYDTNRYNKYTTLDRRRNGKSKDSDYISVTLPRSRASTPRYGSEPYRNQPGRIEDYEPGHSSISELEARQWWDEVLEIFDRWLERNPDGQGPDSHKLLTDAIHRRRQEEKGQPIYKAQSPKSFMTYALKDSGYISDPQHVFKRREDDFQTQLSPQEQKEAYRVIQKGGEVPLRGLRKPAPERPKEDRTAQLEYFPLSPTLTRIRVHKQNITPLSQFPFLQFPVTYQQNAVSYPNLPFGVCNSFSHVQIFPPCTPLNQPVEDKVIPAVAHSASSEKNSGENRKFSVQLQNISETNDYVQIVPKPRSQPKKAPIYANIPVGIVREEKSATLEVPLPRKRNPEGANSNVDKKKSSPPKGSASYCKTHISGEGKTERKTFSDFKRIAPSILSKSLSANKQKESFGGLQRVVSPLNAKKTVPSKKVQTPDKSEVRLIKSSRNLSVRSKSEVYEKKLNKPVKKILSSVSLRKEKASAGKELKKENVEKTKEIVYRSEDEESDHLVNSIESQTESVFIDSTEEDIMSAAYDSVKPKSTFKHKVESNVTEAFRSRSFSPDVRRKVPKPSQPVTPPTPPKRKQSKNSSTLRMWSKMMVTYPYHRSRLDAFDSNVKFLREKLQRKLEQDAEDKENESQLGDDVETVRTVKKEKDGSMSIKTDRYVNIARPISKSIISPLKYTYNEHGRRVLSEPRVSTVSTKMRRYGDVTPEPDLKRAVGKQKSDTVMKSSTIYSVRRPATQEDKRKSVKVTVAVSSKGKEFMRKSVSVPSAMKPPAVKSSSPCPSTSSYKSGLSVKSFSEKGSTISSPGLSPRSRVISPSSSAGRISSPSRSTSPASIATPVRRKVVTPPLTLTFGGVKTKKSPMKKSKEMTKQATEKIKSEEIKCIAGKTDMKRKVKKIDKLEGEKKTKRNGVGKTLAKKKDLEKKSEGSMNEVTEHSNLVRTDSFFQNLFLRGPPDKRPMTNVERTCSVLERARRYQRCTEAPKEQKGEPSLSLIRYYLTQKRPVSLSRFRHLDRELSSSRSPSPYLNRSPSYHLKLTHFDSLSQFGEDDFPSGQVTPNVKGRSSSEPPMIRPQVISPEERIPIKPASRLSVSETSSLRTSPNSSRSPSCRRIRTLKPSGSTSDLKRRGPRARSVGEVEESKPKPFAIGSLAHSTSSLNLSNFSDHGEYQSYVLELMHSKEKCQRFRDLHKFYSSLERMGELERATSVTDLRPRMRHEEIIDFDRWKQLRTKERAEAELKSLVGNLLKVQKEKDLVFRTTDVEAVRWKGDRGLRLKERSVEDLKEQFNKTVEEVAEVDNFKKCLESGKDVYKPFWRGNSIVNLASNLNATTASYRGRPVTLEELERIKAAEERLARKFGLKSFSKRGWSSLSTDQVNSLKSQLSEIYTQELRKKGLEIDELENYEVTVPDDSSVKTPGEKGLYVRCNSALTKDQVFSGKNDDMRIGKKSGSISALPSWKSDGENRKALLQLPWKEEAQKGMSKPLSENEKKRLSMTLSKEVLEKLTKTPVKTHLLPRETLGALVVASSALRTPIDPPQEAFSPRTCYSLETSEDGKSKNDFLLVLTPTEKGKDVEKVVEEWANGTSDNSRPDRTTSITELESASASSETSVKTVIRTPVDVLKKVEYYEDLQQSAEQSMAAEGSSRGIDIKLEDEKPKMIDRYTRGLVHSHSLEDIKDYFGELQRYTVSSGGTSRHENERTRNENFHSLRRIFEEDSQTPIRYNENYKSSNESVFSLRSRSVSPDPTKYYRAYLRMVKCGAVRKLRNKFESWEDLLALSSERGLSSPPKRYASDPELTRDLLRRYGTDPTKVTVRGQEVGDVRWLRTKYEKEGGNPRRRFRSPVHRSPLSATDRFMPHINVISKTAELQMTRRRSPDGMPNRFSASPEPYRSLSEYSRDRDGCYHTGEVDKLRRKFEKLHAAERLSILGQMYTSTPDVNELRDIAPYLGCSWVAHRHPEPSKTSSSPDLQFRRPDLSKKFQVKPRPHSSSPVRPKQPSSILKTPPQRDIFADQKFDPSIHRPLFRYQPDVDQSKRGSADYPQWRQWNKPSVKFKESVDFFPEAKPRESTPDSPRKYVESEVTIHYKSPVRCEAKALLSEDELARRQAESMKRIYKEERRRKYLQELQDMNSRRHADNFIPSQKSPIPLNRYDDFPDENPFHFSRARDHSAEPVLVARGLYDFVGRRPRELAFRRGDIIFIIKQLDKNWCEGELNGAVGLFPLSYVEIIPYSEYNPKFGRARAKYDFVPQTSLELSARKGEMITLVRKIDENWFEGRIGDRTGIIPASYCQVLSLPQLRIPNRSERATSTKPVASPAAHSLIHNGGAVSSKHYYTPFYGGRNSPGRSTTSPAVREAHAAIDQLIDEALFHLEEDIDSRRRSPAKPLNLRVNPRPEPALYQVLFNHVPNNDDELELIQGETVLVLEKCGDGWYIGSKTTGGKLGIFPGTHVRRIGPEFV